MESYKVKIYPAAKQDLLDIVDYLNTLSPDVALRYAVLRFADRRNCRPVAYAGTVSTPQ